MSTRFIPQPALLILVFCTILSFPSSLLLLVSAAPQHALLSLYDVRSNTSRCLDSLPLDTCLFGTRFSLSSSGSSSFSTENHQQFVELSIFHHRSGRSCQSESAKSHEDHSLGRLTITVPVGIKFSLREFLANHNRERNAHHPGLVNNNDYLYNKKRSNIDPGHKLADSLDFYKFRSFGRSMTSSGTIFGTTPQDEDSILIQDCFKNKTHEEQSLCSFQIFGSRHRSFISHNNDENAHDHSSSNFQILRFDPVAFAKHHQQQHSHHLHHNNEEVSSPLEYVSDGSSGLFCIALTSAPFALSSIISNSNNNNNHGYIMKEVYESNSDCLKRKDGLIWQMIPLPNNKDGIIHERDEQLYTTLFYEGEHRIVRGNKLDIVGATTNNNKNIIDDAQTSSLPVCLQASYLNSLYSRSCGTALEFFSERWSGPLPLQTIDSTQRVYRQLNYDIDPICRPATCVSFLVFRNKHQCDIGRKMQKKYVQEHAQILTLQCGGFHDRDSTGGLLHNVFLWCSKNLDKFQLYGECEGSWCKVPFSLGTAANAGNQTCVKVDQKLLSKTKSVAAATTPVPEEGAGNDETEENQQQLNQNQNEEEEAADKKKFSPFLYFSILETAVECSTFGISVMRPKDVSTSNSNMDNDRFVSSQSCIPTRAGDDPRISPHCVDWNINNNNNNNRGKSASSIQLHIILDTAIVSLEEFPKKVMNLLEDRNFMTTRDFSIIRRREYPLHQEQQQQQQQRDVDKTNEKNVKLPRPPRFFPNSSSRPEYIFAEFSRPSRQLKQRQLDENGNNQRHSNIHITLSNFKNMNTLATLNSLTQLQYEALGIVSLSFEGFLSTNGISSSSAGTADGVDVDDESSRLDPFILPKSFRKGEVEYHNDEMTNTQGPMPTRHHQSLGKITKFKKTFAPAAGGGLIIDHDGKTEKDDSENNNNNNLVKDDDGQWARFIINALLFVVVAMMAAGFFYKYRHQKKVVHKEV